jgi:hypothetical protein
MTGADGDDDNWYSSDEEDDSQQNVDSFANSDYTNSALPVTAYFMFILQKSV